MVIQRNIRGVKTTPLRNLFIGMDRNGWLPVEGIVDLHVSTGQFKLDSGKVEHGNHVVIELEHVKFDDGQAALDVAMNRRGTLRVRIPGVKRVMLAELMPYRVVAGINKRYSVSARLANITWEAVQ